MAGPMSTSQCQKNIQDFYKCRDKNISNYDSKTEIDIPDWIISILTVKNS
jgi:hypothetical protein